MTTYVVTTSNYDNPAFWNSISESAAGHTLDFSALPSFYVVSVEPANSIIWIWDGGTWRSITESGMGGFANLGAPTELHYFTEVIVGDARANFEGTDGADNLTSGANNDEINGGLGNDTITSGGGNDTIVAGDGDDLIYAGDGDDFVDATSTAAGNDSIYGGGGNDTLQHDTDTDIVDGGAGDDYIVNVDGTGAARVTTIDGGAGTDTYVLDDSEGGSFSSSQIVNLETGEVTFNGAFRDSITGIENIEIIDAASGASGDSGDNRITGIGDFSNEFGGGAGRDTIDGGAGADDISGDSVILDPADFADTGGPATTLIVTNSSDGPIDLWYIDGAGVEQFLVRTEAGDTQGVSTFEGTNWVLRDEEGYYLQLIRGAANQTVDFGNTGLADTLEGGDGDDTLRGMFGDDQLNGGAGNDLLYGGYGNDTFRLEDVGSDIVYGGAGHDVLDLSGVTISGVSASFSSIEEIFGSDQVGGNSWSWNTNAVTFHGGTGGDAITGGVEGDTLHGNDGADSLTGGHGADSLTGGAGDDTLSGDGGSLTWTDVGNGATVTGTSGNDIFEWTGGAGHTADITLDDGSGTDTDADNASDAVFVASSGNGATLTVRGFDLYRDKIKVAEDWTSNTVTYNADGHHTITLTYASGNVQTFELYHESGEDFYLGEVFEVGIAPSLATDNDTIQGGAGDDTITGGAGDDALTGGSGADSIEGGDGDDLIVGDLDATTTGGSFGLFVMGSAGTTALTPNGTFTFDAGAGSETVEVTDDDTAFEDWSASSGSAIDTGAPQVLTNDLTIGGTTYSAGETIHAVAQAYITNTTTGETGQAWLIQISPTMSGNTYWAYDIAVNDGDQITWTASNDTNVQSQPFADASGLEYEHLVQVDGQPTLGDDTLRGGAGDDTILGGGGDDGIWGGDGADSIDAGVGADTVFAGNQNDNVSGGLGDDSLYGEGGNDTLDGGGGDDRLEGGGGSDSLSGGDGADTIIADWGADTLVGGEGDDSLDGGADNDLILGGEGSDQIDAGSGADTVIMEDDHGDDVIDGGTGTDLLDASDVSYDITLDLSAGDPTDGASGTLTSGLPTPPAGMHYVRVFEPDDPSVINSSGIYPNGAIDFDQGTFHYVLVQDNDTVLNDSQNNDADQVFAEDLDGLPTTGNGIGAPGMSTYTDANGNNFFAGWLTTATNAGPTGVPSQSYLFVSDAAGGTPQGTATFTGSQNFNGSVAYSSFTAPAQGTATFSDMEETALGAGDDTVIGSSGADSVATGAGNDSVLAGAGDDTISGGDGDDYIEGGDGNDVLMTGLGNDTLDGGAGADTLTGGADADVFVVDDGGDLITDFDALTGIGNADTTDNDFVDLTAFYNATTLADWNTANPSTQYFSALGWLRADQQDGTLDQAGGLQVQDGGSAVAASSMNAENTGVVCFTKGTAILTPLGGVLIEDMRVGDLVITADNGPQPIRWIGKRQLDHTTLMASPNLRPVQIKAGVLGNERPLLVSPQHCMMIGNNNMARAKHLAEKMQGVRVAHGKRSVCYVHLMFDAHQMIFAENTPSESFFPGPMSLKMMPPEARAELLTLFPELKNHQGCREHIIGKYGETARPIVAKRALTDLLAILQKMAA